MIIAQNQYWFLELALDLPITDKTGIKYIGYLT